MRTCAVKWSALRGTMTSLPFAPGWRSWRRRWRRWKGFTLDEKKRQKSVDKDNMEFEGRVTCYQLDQASAALKDTP